MFDFQGSSEILAGTGRCHAEPKLLRLLVDDVYAVITCCIERDFTMCVLCESIGVDKDFIDLMLKRYQVQAIHDSTIMQHPVKRQELIEVLLGIYYDSEKDACEAQASIVTYQDLLDRLKALAVSND